MEGFDATLGQALLVQARPSVPTSAVLVPSTLRKPAMTSSLGRPSLAALGRKGFRPMFLLAATFAALVVPLWLLALRGTIDVGGHLGAATWHAHEMIIGFAAAVIAGFLLTAVSNWTGRETLAGHPLFGLAALWLTGRVLLVAGRAVPIPLAAAADLAFLPAVAVVVGRPLLATGNRRNLIMLGILGALFAANLTVWLDALGVMPGARRRATVVALDVVILLLSLIAGRVFPMFTRNATGVATIRSHPRLDAASVGALAVVALLDAWGNAGAASWVAAAAGILAAARAVHWGARHTAREPLLWILHVAWAWVPIGLLLRGASGFGWYPGGESSAMHALTVGALGAATLGMMARVALGHTGRPLRAAPRTHAAFALVTVAAVTRIGAALLPPAHYGTALLVAGVAWTLSFALYLADYAPILCRPRVDGKPG